MPTEYRLFNVVVPPNIGADHAFQFWSPLGGCFAVTVPPDVVAGQTMQVRVPEPQLAVCAVEQTPEAILVRCKYLRLARVKDGFLLSVEALAEDDFVFDAGKTYRLKLFSHGTPLPTIILPVEETSKTISEFLVRCGPEYDDVSLTTYAFFVECVPSDPRAAPAAAASKDASSTTKTSANSTSGSEPSTKRPLPADGSGGTASGAETAPAAKKPKPT